MEGRVDLGVLALSKPTAWKHGRKTFTSYDVTDIDIECYCSAANRLPILLL